MCNCGAVTETTIRYLLCCQFYSIQIAELLNGVYKLDSTLQNFSERQLLTVLLHGSEKFALNVNKGSTKDCCLKATERLVQHLFRPTTFAKCSVAKSLLHFFL